jgi:ABC-type multidrug transport system ATPase subunit
VAAWRTNNNGPRTFYHRYLPDNKDFAVKEIRLDSAFLAFGTREILRGASLSLQQGKITGLLGRNGCGKSCLLKILTGQLKPANVYVGIDGVFTKNLYHHPGLINYLPQHVCHPDGLRLGQLLVYYNIDANAFWGRHAQLFPAGNPRFGHLSGGARRLFEVLLVLEANTHFTLLDEPFSHIMPLHIEYVQAVIRRKSLEKGMLVTDHKYQHVLDLADTLYLMHAGTTTIVSELTELVRLGYVSSIAP